MVLYHCPLCSFSGFPPIESLDLDFASLADYSFGDVRFVVKPHLKIFEVVKKFFPFLQALKDCLPCQMGRVSLEPYQASHGRESPMELKNISLNSKFYFHSPQHWHSRLYNCTSLFAHDRPGTVYYLQGEFLLILRSDILTSKSDR